MQNHAYDAMQSMQENHWWWRGMRALYHAALRPLLPASPNPRRKIIDVGCGFGANLPVLEAYGDVVGVDVSLEALQAIKTRPRLGLVQAEADALPFRAGTFDAVALLAVVEHVDRDDRVVSESYRVARPGAVQILLTSAFMLLWSHHDVANNHRRRYRRGPLNQLQTAAGWKILHTSYVNAFLFPAVALVRLLQRRSEPAETSQYDMGPDLGPANRLLEAMLRLEAWLVTTAHVSLPFGVDIFSLSRKEDKPN